MFEPFLFLQKGTTHTEETKYYLCLNMLPVDVLNRIDSFLIVPPDTNQYTALTALLLKLYQLLEHQNSKALLLLPKLNTMIALVSPGRWTPCCSGPCTLPSYYLPSGAPEIVEDARPHQGVWQTLHISSTG